MVGKIVKASSNGYTVRNNDNDYQCTARGKLKLTKYGLMVGDNVEFHNGVILKVFERKNQLIRPRVSNVDAVIIVVAPLPKPDYYLVDKVLITAEKLGLEALIVLNKSELDSEIITQINQYKTVCDIISVSAKTGEGLNELKQKLQGKTVVFAGQSAVGKTSLVNALFGVELRVGDLSEKIERGKHTTTYSQIFEKDGVCVIDSPGFAVLEVQADMSQLSTLYGEYEQLAVNCKFRGCTHTEEPDCAVKKAVSEGKLSKERYDRYVEIFNDIKNRRKDYGKN